MSRWRTGILVIVIVWGVGAHGAAFAQEYAGMADAKAIIVAGNVRFTVLTPRVIRMEWAADGGFEDRPSLTFVNRRTPVPAFRTIEQGDTLTIITEKLRIHYRRDSDSLTERNCRIEFNVAGMGSVWRPGQVNRGNLDGTTRTLDGYSGDISTKDSSRLKLEEGMLSREGWTLIDDTQRPLLDDSEWPWVTPRRPGASQDWYFFAYGTDYKAALKDFVTIAGRIALPPKYAFGYWYSRWRSSSELEFRELVNTFRSLDIPLDVLVIDMDWHLTSLPEFYKDGKRTKDQAGEDYGWTGFTWNRSYFPDPKRFLDWTSTQGLKTCLNLHPASGIQPHEAQYPEMARAMGIDPATRRYVPFNIVDKRFTENYFKLLLHPMEDDGVDFWWLDWQQWSTTPIAGVNPTFYLNYVHFTDMERRNRTRPLIYHRWGGLGNHRYQIGFSGDAKISWESLAFQPYFTATAANVGFGYWGNDIGGFFGEPNTPEQFVRWFQFGVFSPILKTHATGRNFGILRKLWEYPPKEFLHLKELVHLRYALIPYLYSSARFAYDTGISICRPLYYEHPTANDAYAFRNEYAFGNDMIVHPIARPVGVDSLFALQRTWLPAGMWYEWATGSMLEGNRVVERAFGLTEIPVYVRAGAIIPMQPPMHFVDEVPNVPRVLMIVPGVSGATRLYDDEGNTSGYRQGHYAFTNVRMTMRGTKMAVVIDPVEGAYPDMPTKRRYELRIPNVLPPSAAWINDEAQMDSGWQWDAKECAVIVQTPAFDVRKQNTIVIEFLKGDVALVDGLKGMLRRMYDFSLFLADRRNFRKQAEWNDALYSSDLVMRAAQTGLRIAASPTTMEAEALQFRIERDTVLEMLEQLTRVQPSYRPHLDFLKMK